MSPGNHFLVYLSDFCHCVFRSLSWPQENGLATSSAQCDPLSMLLEFHHCVSRRFFVPFRSVLSFENGGRLSSLGNVTLDLEIRISELQVRRASVHDLWFCNALAHDKARLLAFRCGTKRGGPETF